MKAQNYEVKNERIQESFERLKSRGPIKARLNLSWSNWGFGLESLEDSCERLKAAGVGYIELHGNHYGDDLGYRPDEVLATLGRFGMKVSGICGMFSADNDLSSNRGIQRQAAVDYIRRELQFAHEVGATYLLVVPGAVGRNAAYDGCEWDRSVVSLRLVAPLFEEYGIKAAIEPIRSAEVSLVHTISEAKRYITDVDRPGVQHINGDIYHMQSEERHIGEAILEAGDALVNLHLADSNRCALGDGAMDIDTIIMALYLIGYNAPGRFATPEPLGPGGDPYPAMNGKPARKALDELVGSTVAYFRERESALLE